MNIKWGWAALVFQGKFVVTTSEMQKAHANGGPFVRDQSGEITARIFCV
ncbi:hypothetical protein TR2A62_1672 [Thalassobium sp. R2A62]|nr:hypothetical protein TR2A62_1672 [Thalassobium sp. R2A62]